MSYSGKKIALAIAVAFATPSLALAQGFWLGTTRHQPTSD